MFLCVAIIVSNEDRDKKLFEISARTKARQGEVCSPPGKVETVITYLQMMQRPSSPPLAHPGEKVALLRAERPTISFYRYLYDTVGAPWMWYERRAMGDETLRQIVHDPKVEIYVLYVHGVPAGYAELDARVPREVELAYFGLVPQFMGRGLGKFLLRSALDAAWDKDVDRVWVHTCNFDHPRAIAVYQKAGFVPYKQETEIIDDPRPQTRA